MTYGLDDLQKSADIDSYILIFDDMIFNSELTPSEAFAKYDKDCSAVSNVKWYTNIRPIIFYDRLDYFEKLYQADIKISTYFNIVHCILFNDKLDFLDMMIKYEGEDFLNRSSFDFNVKFYNKYPVVVNHIINKYSTSINIIKLIVHNAIIYNNDYIMKLILQDIGCITEEIFNDICLNLYKSSLFDNSELLTDKMVQYLGTYGFDICQHLNILFVSAIKTHNITFLKFLIKLGADANSIINSMPDETPTIWFK